MLSLFDLTTIKYRLTDMIVTNQFKEAVTNPYSPFERKTYLLLRRADGGRIRMLSTSQKESSPSFTELKTNFAGIESLAPRPVCNRAVKNPVFPSGEYSPFSIV